MKFNSRRSTSLNNVVLFITSILVMLLLVILSGRVSADDPGDADATGTALAMTLTAGTPTPTSIPTSDVPANFVVIDFAGDKFATSLALNPDGIPVIAYSKGTGLALARCNNALTCNAPQIATLDSNATSGVKMVLDGDIPVFVFVDTDKFLKLGRCQNAACSSVTLKTIETVATILQFDLVLDQNQFPVIIYKRSISCGIGCTDGPLKLVRCNDAACATPTITQLESNIYNSAISVAIDANNNPIIAYSPTFSSFYVALCYDPNCTDNYITSIGSSGAGYPSLQIDSNGLPVLAYASGGLNLAYCDDNLYCANPTISLLNSGNNGFYVSLALDAGDLPVMSHYNAIDNDLKLTRCADPTCSSVDTVVLDSLDRVGIGTSLALSDGKPYISYINQTTFKLMLYIENKPPPPTITPTPSLTPSPTLTPSLTPSSTLTPSITPSLTPTPVTPTSPPDSTPALAFFATHQPTLTWNAVSWAWGYQIEIDDDAAFGSPLIADVDANTLSYTVESELINGAYFWHVRAKQNDTDWADWSASEMLVVSAP